MSTKRKSGLDYAKERIALLDKDINKMRNDLMEQNRDIAKLSMANQWLYDRLGCFAKRAYWKYKKEIEQTFG